MKVFSALLTASLFILASPAAHAEVRYTAQIFDTEGNKPLLFNYKSEGTQQGDLYVITNTFTATDGAMALNETIRITKSGAPIYYEVDQPQTGAKGRVEVTDGRAKFFYTKKGGTEKTASEKVGSDFIVTSVIPIDLAANWDKIMKGETLERRLAVVDRMETVGFEFNKEKEVDLDGKKAVVVRMKPSSFVIAAIVKPLHFYMSPDGKVIYEIIGRTTVKKDGGKDLNARSVYSAGNSK